MSDSRARWQAFRWHRFAVPLCLDNLRISRELPSCVSVHKTHLGIRHMHLLFRHADTIVASPLSSVLPTRTHAVYLVGSNSNTASPVGTVPWPPLRDLVFRTLRSPVGILSSGLEALHEASKTSPWLERCGSRPCVGAGHRPSRNPAAPMRTRDTNKKGRNTGREDRTVWCQIFSPPEVRQSQTIRTQQFGSSTRGKLGSHNIDIDD